MILVGLALLLFGVVLGLASLTVVGAALSAADAAVVVAVARALRRAPVQSRSVG
jgi:hypothetical protein